MLTILTIISIGLFLFWQLSNDKARIRCRVCKKRAVKDRIHDYSKSSLYIQENKLLKNNISTLSISKPPFQKLGKEYFLYPEMKVNEMGVFHGERGRNGRHNPFFSQFYPTKYNWNNNFSNQSNLYCGKCFSEKFKNDKRVLFDVLQEKEWFT
jgi:hypothetical protein